MSRGLDLDLGLGLLLGLDLDLDLGLRLPQRLLQAGIIDGGKPSQTGVHTVAEDVGQAGVGIISQEIQPVVSGEHLLEGIVVKRRRFRST